MSTTAVIGLAVFATVVITFVVAAYLRRWPWTGFARTSGAEQGSKTLWDWLQLLVIPLGLAAVAFALNVAQSGREQRREDRRAALERSIAADRRREDALAAYVEQMSNLMLQRGLLTSKERSETRTIARTLTLSVLRRLDARRKGVVLQFLSEARLIRKEDPKVSLRDADLRNVRVRGKLGGISLDDADLRGADFRETQLGNTSFYSADLRRADFSRAFIYKVAFEFARLDSANFSRVYMTGSGFSGACLIDALFVKALLVRVHYTLAAGRGVDFSGARLQEVNFDYTLLDNPTLTGTRLVKTLNPEDARREGTVPDPDCQVASR
jgi:uncharacterized protein YjbI with pentapeptide repeats